MFFKIKIINRKNTQVLLILFYCSDEQLIFAGQKQRFMHVHLHCFGFLGHVGQSHLIGQQLQTGHGGQRQIKFLLSDLLADGVTGHTLSHSAESSHFLCGEPAAAGNMIATQMIVAKIIIKLFMLMIYLRVFTKWGCALKTLISSPPSRLLYGLVISFTTTNVPD